MQWCLTCCRPPGRDNADLARILRAMVAFPYNPAVRCCAAVCASVCAWGRGEAAQALTRAWAQIQLRGAFVLARFVYALPRPERFTAHDPQHKKKGKENKDLKAAAKKIRSTTTKAVQV